MLPRIVLALALMAGFYVLAIGIAAGLLWIAYGIIFRDHFILPFPPLLIALAGIILWSIAPRRDRFIAPGPPLEEMDHPRLFQVIREIADRTGQAMPSEVFLTLDMNAMVAERGGFVGIGSRRVMAIGLPVLQYLTVPELKAVVAHEFGHYHGGDTKLGPWIYKTCEAIERTIRTLSAGNDGLPKPFVVYGNMFLRVTHAVSRRQEYVADALAARLVGVEHSRNAMLKLAVGDLAFGMFFMEELEPVLVAGYVPPVTEGFGIFVDSSRVSEMMSENLAARLANEKMDPYATHPPLAKRLQALGASPSSVISRDDSPRAITLMDGVDELERQTVGCVAKPGRAVTPKQPIGWDEVPQRVILPRSMWIERQLAPELDGLTIALLRTLSTTPDALRARFGFLRGTSEDLLRNHVGALLTRALQAALARAGWAIQTAVGEPVYLVGPKGRLSTADLVRDVLFHKMESAAWDRLCSELDLDAIDLGGGGDPEPGEDLRPVLAQGGILVTRCGARRRKRAEALVVKVFGDGGPGFADGRLYGKDLTVGPFLWDTIREHPGLQNRPSPAISHDCPRCLLPLRLKRIDQARRMPEFLDDGYAGVAYARFNRGTIAEAATVLAERYRGLDRLEAVDETDVQIRSIPHWTTLQEPMLIASMGGRRLLLEFDKRDKLVYVDDYSRC